MPDRLAQPRLADAVRDVFGGRPWRLLIGAVGIVVVFVIVGAWLREPIQAAAASVVARFGPFGIAVAAFAGELIPPFGFQPSLFIGYTGGVGLLPLFLLVEVGSFLASCCCWLLGRALRASPRALAWLDARPSARIVRRYGTATVGIAALGPLPYGAITLLGAALGLPFVPAVRGMLLRPLKIAASLALLAVGWSR
jgi:membrane protein YqaA with SNARE-associated domain